MYNYIPMDKKEMINYIYNNSKCTLAMSECDMPYLVPMCYKVKEECDDLYIIMKSKDSGKKMTCMNNNDNVAILIESNGFGTTKSVILYGTAYIIDDDCNDKSIIKICITNMTGRIFCY